MTLDYLIKQVRILKSQGHENEKIMSILKEYGATANESDRALKELQKQEKRNFSPKEF